MTVRRGDKGELVIAVQTALVNHGFDVGHYGIDGDFGPDTESAVKQFQQANGLAVDGVVGNETAAALGISLDGNSTADSSPSVNSHSSNTPLLLGGAAIAGFAIWKFFLK